MKTFISGGAVTGEIEELLAAVPNERLEKPFTVGCLASAVQAAIESVAVK